MKYMTRLPATLTYFHKPITALCGHGANIIWPKRCEWLNYEGEIVIVIDQTTAHKGTCQKMSREQLDRGVVKFVWRHNLRELGAIAQMESIATRLIGMRLMNNDLATGVNSRLHWMTQLDESMMPTAQPNSKPRSEEISEDVFRRAERIASRLVSTRRIKNRAIKATKTLTIHEIRIIIHRVSQVYNIDEFQNQQLRYSDANALESYTSVWIIIVY